MKCNKCKVAERHGSLAYCLPCNAEYMKAYRLAKQSKQAEPVATIEVEPSEVASTPTTPVQGYSETQKPKFEPKPSPVYWSYYVTKGTPLWHQMIEAEKVYLVA